jgi:hypothetical protein
MGLLLGLCLVAGILVVGGAVAQAARPFNVQQFMPNDTQNWSACPVASPGCKPDALSDKFDGVDSLAHLTAVASAETETVTWYACPLGTPSAPTNSDLVKCTVTIGSDSTGVIPPIGPAASSPADEAYDVTWDVPGSLDQQRRDIVALACIGPGQNLDGAEANCRADEEDSIFLEDAQTGNAQNQTTAGEFGRYRTFQTCIGTATGSSACDPFFKAFPHGSPVPNDGFDFQAFTSDDVTTLQWEVNSQADAAAEPAGTNFFDFGGCTLEQTFTNFKRWLCRLTDVEVPNDAEMALSLLDADAPGSQASGAGGYCNSNNNPTAPGPPPAQNQVPAAHDDCVLDVHYAVSSARQAARVVQTFAPNPPSPSATASCATPDTDESSQLGTTEDVVLCLFDQFTDPFNGPWTEETSGAGQLLACGGEGFAHDHNGDGRIEDCVGTTGSDGVSSGIRVSNPSGPPGDQILTSCLDPQNATTNPPVANHGCADAPTALKTTLTVHWGTSPTEVFLVFNNPAPSNASDPCRTGTTFKRNEVGEHDDLTVCTFDSSGNPVPTDTSGSLLQWTITGAQGEEPTAVRFNPAPPPDETTGAGASATAGVDAVQEGDNFINVFLLNSNGDVVDSFSIEKQVHRGTQTRPVATNLTARKGRKFIRGKAKASESECESARSVTLFRRRRGPDETIGNDTTNQFGRWGVKTGKRRGTYYARVAASVTTDTQTGDTLNCGSDQSKDVRRD